MGRLLPDDWFLKFFERWQREINFFIKITIYLFLIGYIGYFIKIGFKFTEQKKGIYGPLEIMINGVIFTVFLIVFFFIYHFVKGGFNPRLIGLFLGLALGGTSVGLIAGLIGGFMGWIMGGVIGITIIITTFDWYFKKDELENGKGDGCN